jgi:hypothetical protein
MLLLYDDSADVGDLPVSGDTMSDAEVLAFVERWAPTYWRVKSVRMSIIVRPGKHSNYYEVEVVLPGDTALVRLVLDENDTLVVGGVLWPNE